jgi:hypothetical protein
MSLLPLRIGADLNDHNRSVYLNPDALSRHLHLVGATGSGKTNFILQLLPVLMAEPANPNCIFVIDPMGNLSFDLLRWIAGPWCPDHVRDRLVYIEPARDEVVMPFNPLQTCSEDSRYYHVARSVDLILRAWSAQNLAEQPRLMQWSYKAMTAMAAMKFPIAISRFLLHPGSDEHAALLDRLPDAIRHHWLEILKAKGGEAVRILESVRNRFDPFYEAPQTLRMFGTFQGRFDVERLIRERRIVIVNVAKLGKIPLRLGSTIGGLILNEVFETASNMTARYGRASVEPTYVLLDEFERFVGPDIEDALPTVRQMGLRLILAHQSFSQLQQGDVDLSHMVWQARNRLMFANSFEDADIIANELAVQTFDAMKVKHELWTRRQTVTGYRSVWLTSHTTTDTHADSRIDQRSVGFNSSDSESRPSGSGRVTRSDGSGTSHGHTTGSTFADSYGISNGESESLVPIHEDFQELSSVTFESFDEHLRAWQKKVRNLTTGLAYGRFLDDPKLYHLGIEFDPVDETPELATAVEELLQRNFEQDFFISREEADRLAEQERLRLLTPPAIELPPQIIDLPPQIPNMKPANLLDAPRGEGEDVSQVSGTPGEAVGETLNETTGEAVRETTRDTGDSSGAAADRSEASERAREAGSIAPPKSAAEPTVDPSVNQSGETTNSDAPKPGSDDSEEPPAFDPFRRTPRT